MKTWKQHPCLIRLYKILSGTWILYVAIALLAVYVEIDLRLINTRLADLQKEFNQYSSWKNREDSILIQRNVFQPISRGQFSIRIKDMRQMKDGIRFSCSILNMTAVPVSDFKMTPIMKEIVYEKNSRFNFQVRYLTKYMIDGIYIGRIENGKTRDFSFDVKNLKFDDMFNIKWKRQTLIAFWIEQHKVHPRAR